MRPMVDRSIERFVSHGFDCVIGLGGPFGQNYNGYILVPAAHPWCGLDYSEINADCHGGLTYGAAMLPWEPAPVNPSRARWFGFDTCHSCDAVRGAPYEMRIPHGTFKDMDYVRAELEKLAAHAKLVQAEAMSRA